MNYSEESVKSARIDLQATLTKCRRWIDDFTARLDDEVTLLGNDELNGLQYVGERKQQLLSELRATEPELSAVFTMYSHLSEVRQLKAQLQQCKDRNLENQRIVMQQLTYTNRGLELLRSLLKMNDLSLYGEHGQLRIKREKRRIGSA